MDKGPQFSLDPSMTASPETMADTGTRCGVPQVGTNSVKYYQAWRNNGC